MPVDDEYGRRQITLQQPQQQQQQHAVTPSSISSSATASSAIHLPCSIGGCLSTSTDLRYASNKNLLEPIERCYSAAAAATTTTTTASTTISAPTTDRFGSERSHSDRLPSGERYQGVSERYPLGERPQTSISTERLLPKEYLHHQQLGLCQDDRYHYGTCQRYPERYTPVQNVNSLDRYHHMHNGSTTIDRYSRTSTPTDRYQNIIDKEKSTTTNDRYDSYIPAERHRNVTKIRERSSSSDRKTERYHHNHHHQHQQQYQNRYEHQYIERFPTIPCPERFATTNQQQSQQQQQQTVPYMEPPSPAPTNDRFIPPPPLSPDNTPSPDCFPNNSFPSPTTTISTPTEHFIPPPPLSPSPTEKFSPKKIERYDKLNRYHERYHHIKERNQYYHHNNNERYIPPNAHMPVERYVPQLQQQQQTSQQQQQQQSPQQQQPQEAYYNNYQIYDRYTSKLNSNDPYMRRDLTYHYRLPLPYPTNQYQRIRYQHIGTPNRVKCCQYQDNYQLSKSSPSSSSNSSVTSCHGTSLQDIQCQNYQNCTYQPQQQQEKSTQCNNKDCGFVSPNLRTTTTNNNNNNNSSNSGAIVTKQCRHSICVSPSVEYVGASGGRHICATPPPPRGSIGSTDGTICNENCCNRRLTQNTLAVTIWRATTPVQQQQQQQQQQQIQQQQQQISPSLPPQQQSQQRTTTPIHDEIEPLKSSEQQQQQPQNPPPTTKSSQVQRTVSLPPTSPPSRSLQMTRQINYSQSERLPNRPTLSRSISKREMIKKFIKKETATFFGVDEETEEEEQRQWLDRRIRMAERAYGPVKDEYLPIGRHRRAISELVTQPRTMGQLQAERPDVLPGPSDVPDTIIREHHGHDVKLKRKDSVARLTWDGLSYVVNTITRHRPRRRSQQSQLSRSFPPDTPYSTTKNLDDENFFQRISPVSTRTSPSEGSGDDVVDDVDELHPITYRERLTTTPATTTTTTRPSYSSLSGGWRRDPHVVLRHGEQNRPTIGGSRVYSSLLDNVLDNSNRRQYGMGWVGRMFGRSMRKSVAQDEKIRAQLDDMEDHRPMFTYWVTTVQILVLFISLICYGFGPFGIDLRSRSGQVLVTSLSLQQVDYMEPANFWFGPRAGDLIHLGAKFAPCMRIDEKILQEIDKIRAKERETACCIRNDDSGCVQSSQADCSKTISTWKKWSAGDAGPGGRISGSVCGLDPKFCDAPASVHPYEWPDDITKWPICRKTNTQFSVQKRGPRDKIAEHMVCEVIGHPCCIGIHGQCKITTKEYCDFVRGTFHEEASLCSQVSCLNDVCGMLPFYFPETPDQFYRLWTSLFLHAGILQLAITVIIQYYLMRDLEKLTGSLRIGIIYIGSGVAGNLASAIFVPYRADVGPAGSQFGLLACLIVEVLNAWPMLKHPNQALCKLLSITLFLFLIGLLPWVDNYAHLFGFVFGFLLSYALLPFISFGYYDRHKKIALIWICLLSASILFICLILLFYIIPVYDCKICSYFNCIPFTNHFCASQNINFKKEEPIV